MLALTVAPLLSSCVDSRTDPPPPPVTVTAEELFGTWHGWEGSTLTLEPGAKAKTTKLDGQEFAFDDGWRMTGTGTWSVQEPGTYHGGNTVGNGSVVRLKAAPLVSTTPSTDGAVTTLPSVRRTPRSPATPWTPPRGPRHRRTTPRGPSGSPRRRRGSCVSSSSPRTLMSATRTT